MQVSNTTIFNDNLELSVFSFLQVTNAVMKQLYEMINDKIEKLTILKKSNDKHGDNNIVVWYEKQSYIYNVLFL